MEINSCLCVMKIHFNLISQKNEKTELFSQETYNFQILVNDTMIIVDYKDITISSFHLLVVRSWLKEDHGLHKSSLIFFQIYSFKREFINFLKNSALFEP